MPCHYLPVMQNTATRKSNPPRPVLFTNDKGGLSVLSFKVTKEQPCQLLALDPSHKMWVSLQKIEGKHVIGNSLHTAKLAKLYDLGSSGLCVSFEVQDNWKLTSSIFMNRKEMESLRDQLIEFLG